MAKKMKGTVIISLDRCKGCGLCTVGCSLGLLKISESTLNAYGYHPACIERMDECIGCGNCFQMCPDYAITVERVVCEGG